MNIRKKRLIITIVQVLAIVLFSYVVMTNSNRMMEPQTAYVFTKNVEDGRKINEDDIKSIQIPKVALNPQFEVDKEGIIGKYLNRKVDKGHYVYKESLVEEEYVDIFKTMDLSKMRKISLPISFVDGMSGNIEKGDYVDLAYVGAGATEESEFIYADVFEQSIPVWSVNTGEGFKFTDKSTVVDSQASEEDYKKVAELGEGDFSIITLAVTLEQYAEIKAREAAGKIAFVGRFDESTDYDTMGYVIGDYEKIFTGEGFAETGKTLLKDLEEMTYDKSEE